MRARFYTDAGRFSGLICEADGRKQEVIPNPFGRTEYRQSCDNYLRKIAERLNAVEFPSNEATEIAMEAQRVVAEQHMNATAILPVVFPEGK